jgi:hypothetical protein
VSNLISFYDRINDAYLKEKITSLLKTNKERIDNVPSRVSYILLSRIPHHDCTMPGHFEAGSCFIAITS